MNRNPIVPFIIIMVFGIGLMFMLSFMGLGNSKEMAKEKNGGGEKKTEQTAFNPEEVYKQSCSACHGEQYQGGAGPALKGVGQKLSHDQIKKQIVNGGGGMPGGLVDAANADKMAKWLESLK
ncbi:cytochrome c550 [Peribacillus kribbensis]|uniref:cytochrome c550 n=1 Tax=Peribacillus kribbensis TaxID=356658 RepID=UPI00040D300C|nr:cytochrome c [Peribacillus kribbensis]